MARRVRSLHFNLQEGENVVFHRDHTSKRGRDRSHRDNNEVYYEFKRKKLELKQGVDKKTLRYLKNQYNISI